MKVSFAENDCIIIFDELGVAEDLLEGPPQRLVVRRVVLYIIFAKDFGN